MKIQVMPPVPGYYELMALFRMMADPIAYAEKLAELEKARNEINAGLQAREDLSKIDALKAEHAQLVSNAKATRDLASEEAKSVLSRAKTDTEKRTAEWASRRKAQEAKLAERDAELERREAAAAAATKAAEQLAARASADLATAKDQLRQALEMRAEYQAKAEQLRGLVA